MYKQVDIGITKRVPMWSSTSFEFKLDVLNAFNFSNFVPVSGMVAGVTTANDNNRANGVNPDNYDVTTLVGGQQARIVQLTARIRW